MPQVIRSSWRPVVLAACFAALPAAALAQGQTAEAKKEKAQTTTHEQVIPFTIVAADGKNVIYKDAHGATRAVTLPDNTTLTVEGKPVTVADLQPGMKGTAKVTTTTTVTPVHLTEVREGEVIRTSGSSIIVRSGNQIRMFSEADKAGRDVTIIRNGRPAHISDFRRGDRLTATIVTTGTPKVMTQTQVDAVMSGAPEPSVATKEPAAPAAPPRPAGGATPGTSGTTAAAETKGTAAAPHAGRKRLPKTASVDPLWGASGLALIALGLVFRLGRRRAGA